MSETSGSKRVAQAIHVCRPCFQLVDIHVSNLLPTTTTTPALCPLPTAPSSLLTLTLTAYCLLLAAHLLACIYQTLFNLPNGFRPATVAGACVGGSGFGGWITLVHKQPIDFPPLSHFPIFPIFPSPQSQSQSIPWPLPIGPSPQDTQDTQDKRHTHPRCCVPNTRLLPRRWVECIISSLDTDASFSPETLLSYIQTGLCSAVLAVL